MSTTRHDHPAPPELRVGGYRLLTKIGEGGMGVVHLAQARDGNRVALKVLRPHVVGDDEARERLSREVASLRRVRSPRVAEVIDADPWAETPYVATRYVPGLSLHQHVRQEGPIRGGDLHWFARGLAEAMAAVHSVGVLHRDIKPSNVLLEGRSPVLIDFGLARLADDPRLTVTGWLLGTPGYLAPEILYGDDATTASDVHSWAATVVLAATGAPPFGTGPAMAIMDRVRRGEHDLSAVPGDLEPLLRACLAPDPGGRPTTAGLLRHLAPGGPIISKRSAAPPVGQATMPIALAPTRDGDATEVIPADAEPAPSPGPSAGPAPFPPPATLPLTGVQTPARAPFQEPPPPQQQVAAPGPGGTARAQRALLFAGLLALMVLGFAAAPYLSFAVLAVVTVAVRTWSWTAEAARERTARRGRGAWYDGPLTLASTPWYLMVATGGTLMLLFWSAGLAFLVGMALLLFRLPTAAWLMVTGAVLALSVWWGPGGRRLRRPARALATRVTGHESVAWVSVALVVAAASLCGFMLLAHGTSWEPRPGPPWRSGTMLGDLVRLL